MAKDVPAEAPAKGGDATTQAAAPDGSQAPKNKISEMARPCAPEKKTAAEALAESTEAAAPQESEPADAANGAAPRAAEETTKGESPAAKPATTAASADETSEAGAKPSATRRRKGGIAQSILPRRLAEPLRLPRDQMLAGLGYDLKRPFFSIPLPQLSVFAKPPSTTMVSPPDPWPGNAELGREIMEGLFTLAGRSINQPAPLWGPLGAGQDWITALHSFAWLRDLRAAGGESARRAAQDLVDNWILENRFWDQVTWHPVVVGQRLYYWLSQYDFYGGPAELPFRQALLTSARRQASHLSHVLPAGLSGADLMSAVKGLIYAGICLPGAEAFREKGLAILMRDLPRQVMADGGHGERSPASHLSVLRDFIDIRAALHAANASVPDDLQSAIHVMGLFLRLLQQGDGGLPLFNGSNEEEGWQIDIVLQRSGGRKRTLMSAPQNGFQRLQAGRTLVILDAGEPPRPGLDQRAHAGTLSFEMSVGKERVIVNCGAQSGHKDWQDVQRSTAAHSTLIVNETNSSELLPGGGIGQRRPSVTCRRDEDDGNLWLDTSHDGYLELFDCTHHRRIYLSANGEDLRGEDKLVFPKGKSRPEFHSFAIRFHLHPDVQATLTNSGEAVVLKTLKGEGWRFRAAGAVLSLGRSVYLGRAGELRRTQQIVLEGEAKAPETTVKWALQRENKNRA